MGPKNDLASSERMHALCELFGLGIFLSSFN